jgi:hypothetical protein
VAKAHPVLADVDQQGTLGLLQRGEAGPDRAQGALEDREGAGVRRGEQLHRGAGPGREAVESPDPGLAQPGAGRQRLRQRVGATTLGRREQTLHLDQGQRMAGAGLEQASLHRRREPLGSRAAQERGGRLVLERTERDRRKLAKRRAPGLLLADGQQEGDRIVTQPPGAEGQRVLRGRVEPVGVVDQPELGPATLGVGREQAEGGEVHREAVAGHGRPQRERAAKRRRLRVGQRRQPVQCRAQQVEQAREAELALRLGALHEQQAEAGGPAPGPPHQGALAGPGLAADHERAAPADPRAVDQGPDPGPLRRAAEHRCVAVPGIGHGRSYARIVSGHDAGNPSCERARRRRRLAASRRGAGRAPTPHEEVSHVTNDRRAAGPPVARGWRRRPLDGGDRPLLRRLL